ncbi:TerC family protein [Brevibacillus humidisoli]|uniref:TerC family protein n=1 Tax=Brevibacillus humidisoli TaxID=2895522 RepID=UPI001E4EA25F|nr:TerC family protein [Brevibacillus humidisoli]UFJ42990.1 TerC family protein [Brevibacillus humidisoli]
MINVTPEFWTALLSIIVIDLVLAGDNAIVIGLSARNVPKEQQKKVIFWGTAGAIVIRALLTFIALWLLRIPGLLLVGGVLLIWIAYKLLVEEKDHGDLQSGTSLWAAVRTILVADTVMGLDNVLAVAGAAHGDFLLVVLGLLISVPIVIWGSTLILRWVKQYPIILYVGAGVLAWTASKMIIDEPFIHSFFIDYPLLRYGFSIVMIAGVLLLGLRKNREREPA